MQLDIIKKNKRQTNVKILHYLLNVHYGRPGLKLCVSKWNESKTVTVDKSCELLAKTKIFESQNT